MFHRRWSRPIACCLALTAFSFMAWSAPEDADWFRQARFGFFICWGPVSLEGGEIGWSRAGRRPEPHAWSIPSSIPVDVYDNLYKRFNPTRYDPAEWMGIARDAGMQYVVFLTRHHDGFSMFDSAYSDYDIMATPYGRDITKQLADACHAAGLRLGFYYSQPDWRHPDYQTANHARFIKYLHNQVREILTHYGKVDVLWFDGLGNKPEVWDATNLLAMARGLQPGILINNRAGLPGDFYTPEQRVGAFDRQRPWESCITLGTQWTWKPNDTLKSATECIHLLARCAGGDGNLLLDVGPMPDGRIEPRQAERLREIGAWLKRHGESIYGTRGGPYMPAEWGVSTCTGNTVYLHVLRPDWTDGEIVLPPLSHRFLGWRMVSEGTVEVHIEGGSARITLPRQAPVPDLLLALELDRNAAAVEPVPMPFDSLTTGKPTLASSTWENQARYGPSMATDGNLSTRWGAARDAWTATLEVDLLVPKTFNRAIIHEAYAGRVRRFSLQYESNGAWRVAAKGETLGERRVLDFAPVSARRVRLAIEEASDVPTLYEFRLLSR